jgi:RHS repeat-associated protein
VVQSFGYDQVSRLASLTNELSGTANDLSATFAHNPASQIASTVRTGDAYAWTGHFNTNVTGTANGLNQLTSVGPKSLTHDARGNVTAFGTKSFTYSSENLLMTGPGSTTLSYDPGMRLHQTVSGATTTRLLYDGLDRIAEYDGSNALQRRYVHGPDVDEPLVWYEGTGTTDRRFLSSDDLGSIISVTDSSGAVLGLNKYDEYGNPQAGNLGAFGYTGQAWLPSMGIWYYKARVYDPELGRFLQTDPIDVEGGINLYAYVANDPINAIDPLGLKGWCATLSFESTAGNVTQCFPDVGPGGAGRAGAGSGLSAGQGRLEGKSKQAGGKIKRRRLISVPCSTLLRETGPIDVFTNSLTAIVLGGVTGSFGAFQNPSTGSMGNFWSLGGGVGWDRGASITHGSMRSVSDLAGGGLNISVGNILAVGVSTDIHGQRITGTARGIATPGKGGSLTASGTKLFNCRAVR